MSPRSLSSSTSSSSLDGESSLSKVKISSSVLSVRIIPRSDFGFSRTFVSPISGCGTMLKESGRKNGILFSV